MMDYDKFQSNVDGFEIDFPKAWHKVKNSGFSSIMFTPSLTKPNFNMNVCVQDLKAANRGLIPTPEQFLEVSIEQVKEMGALGLEHGSTKIGVDKIDGHYMRYRLVNQIEVAIRQSFFQRETFTYVITLSVPASEMTSELIKTHEHAVASFRLFKSRGYKALTMLPVTGVCQVRRDASYRFTMYHPSDWKSVPTNQANHFHWKAPTTQPAGLRLQMSVDTLQAPIDSALKFNHWIKERMDKQAVDGKVTVTAQKDIEHYLDLTGLENIKYSAIKLSFTSESMEHKGDYEMVCLVIDETVFTFTLTSAAGDMADWKVMLEAIVGAFKLTEKTGLEEEMEKKKKTLTVPANSLTTYNLFVNFVAGYRVLLPNHFDIFTQQSNYYEAVMFTSSKSKHGVPLFSINIEDLGINVKLEQYKGVIAQMITESLEQGRLISDTPSRLDNYQASLTEINGFDASISNEVIRNLFKCAVVKRRFGVLISLRALKSEYENLYTSSIFTFNSFKLLSSRQ